MPQCHSIASSYQVIHKWCYLLLNGNCTHSDSDSLLLSLIFTFPVYYTVQVGLLEGPDMHHSLFVEERNMTLFFHTSNCRCPTWAPC